MSFICENSFRCPLMICTLFCVRDKKFNLLECKKRKERNRLALHFGELCVDVKTNEKERNDDS